MKHFLITYLVQSGLFFVGTARVEITDQERSSVFVLDAFHEAETSAPFLKR